jgi:hypothetical protein
MLKASKQSVDYSRGHAGAHCGKMLDDDKAYCRYFVAWSTLFEKLNRARAIAPAIWRYSHRAGHLEALHGSWPYRENVAGM